MFGQVKLLIYWDDILVRAPEPMGVSQKLRQVFEICKTLRFKLKPAKCKPITDEVQICGRMINKVGVRFHARQYEALTDMQAPTTVGELMEFVHGANLFHPFPS